MNTKLRFAQKHFADMYGTRNLFVNGSFHERAVHLLRRFGRIADAERKGEHMGGKLARSFSYFMSVVEYFRGSVDIARGMAKKFPIEGCAYCGKKPCECRPGFRPDPPNFQPNAAQSDWTIRDWQQHLFEVYGPNNTKRGFWEVFGRGISEFGEFGILNVSGPRTPLSPSLIIDECEREAADVLSWIMAMAYVKGIDLESEVIERYSVCPGCERLVCDCDVIFMSADGKTFSMIGTPDFISKAIPPTA